MGLQWRVARPRVSRTSGQNGRQAGAAGSARNGGQQLCCLQLAPVRAPGPCGRSCPPCAARRSQQTRTPAQQCSPPGRRRSWPQQRSSEASAAAKGVFFWSLRWPHPNPKKLHQKKFSSSRSMSGELYRQPQNVRVVVYSAQHMHSKSPEVSLQRTPAPAAARLANSSTSSSSSSSALRAHQHRQDQVPHVGAERPGAGVERGMYAARDPPPPPSLEPQQGLSGAVLLPACCLLFPGGAGGGNCRYRPRPAKACGVDLVQTTTRSWPRLGSRASPPAPSLRAVFALVSVAT